MGGDGTVLHTVPYALIALQCFIYYRIDLPGFQPPHPIPGLHPHCVSPSREKGEKEKPTGGWITRPRLLQEAKEFAKTRTRKERNGGKELDTVRARGYRGYG